MEEGTSLDNLLYLCPKTNACDQIFLIEGMFTYSSLLISNLIYHIYRNHDHRRWHIAILLHARRSEYY